MSRTTHDTRIAETDSLPDWLAIVLGKVSAMRFGTVQIVVHEGKVTQIECTEKTRLEQARERNR